MSEMNLIIDTDTAGDDVTSLMIAGLSDINLIGITTVAGNVPLDMCTKNALITLEKINVNVPVYRGSDSPLIQKLVTAQYVHGDDGMGNSNFAIPVRSYEKENAVNKILNLSYEYENELIICAQAPLTNLALAVIKDRTLPERIKHLYIMGGAYRHSGNVTPSAEYNFYVDPEAADIVLNAGFKCTLLPWDTCIYDGTLNMEELRYITENNSDLSKFYINVNKSAIEFNNSNRSGLNLNGLTHSDSLLMSIILDNSIIEETIRASMKIEYHSEITRGFSSAIKNNDEFKNVEIITKANKNKFISKLRKILS